MLFKVRLLSHHDLEEYIFIITINFLVTSLSLLSPYYINQIIDYIEHQDREENPPS
jgi:hypothetical protein